MGQAAVDRWRKAKYQHKAVHRCVYCQRPLTYDEATVDHKIPKSRGGLDTPSNFCIACQPCNSDKDNMTASEYRTALRIKKWPKRSLVGKGPTGPWTPERTHR